MKFYALVSKRHLKQVFRESLEVSNEIQPPQKRGQTCVEITIDRQDEFFEPYEVPITDRYDRTFLLPVELLNEGAVRLVTEQELKAWEEETKDRIPLP